MQESTFILFAPLEPDTGWTMSKWKHESHSYPSSGNQNKSGLFDMITLYHSSPVPFSEVRPYGSQAGATDFGGIFALTNPEGSIDHGPFLHRIELRNEEVLTQYVINTEISSDFIESVLRHNLRIEHDEDLYLAKQITELDRNVFDFSDDERERLCYVFRSDMDQLAWDGQRVRGQIAHAAGFKAVEMTDEHGRSYLVLPGVQLSLVAATHSRGGSTAADGFLAALDKNCELGSIGSDLSL